MRAPGQIASAATGTVQTVATTGVAVVVAVVAVASAKVKVSKAKDKAPMPASVSALMQKVAPWRQRLLWVKMHLASQGRIVARAMRHRVSALNVVNVQSVRNAVVVAVAAQTARTCHKKVRFAAMFAMTHVLKAEVDNLRTIAKLASPGVKAVAVVAIAANHVVKAGQSAPSVLPALTTAHQVQHPQK